LDAHEIKPWQVLESSVVFSNRWLRIRQDICRTNRGNTADYYVIERPSYVVIVPVTSDGQVILVRQYKHGAQQITLELPAGFVDEGEEPLACAHRELLEETGYKATTMEPLSVLFASTTASAHHGHFFLATGLAYVGENHWDPNENIAVEPMDLSAAVQAVVNSQMFQDLNTPLALLLAWHRLTGQGSAPAANPSPASRNHAS